MDSAATASLPCFIPTAVIETDWNDAAWSDECASTTTWTTFPWPASKGCLHEGHAAVLGGSHQGPSECLGGASAVTGGPTRRLYVLGDSHAVMMLPGLQSAFAQTGGRAGQFEVRHVTCVGNGCGFNPTDFFVEEEGMGKDDCPVYVEDSKAALSACVKEGDVVIVFQAAFRYAYREWQNLDDQVSFLEEFYLDVLGPKSASLVTADDIPTISGFGRNCAGGNPNCGAVSRNGHGGQADNLARSNQAFRALAVKHAGIFHMEALFEPFCVGAICYGVVPGTTTVAYYDDDHVNTAGSIYLAPFINCFFRSVGLI